MTSGVRSSPGEPARPTVFIPSAQTPAGLSRLFGNWFPIHVVIRTKGNQTVTVAQRADVLWMVVGRAATLTGLGVLLGLVGALALTRLIAGFLYGVRPTDVPTIVGVVALLGTVSLAATWLPARRATKVDPMVALRHE